MITIRDVFTAKAFQNSTVLAGERGLSREVTSITVAEVPDSAKWLRGGELVCTTAFFISSTVEHEREWIESLIENGAAALAIKTSRFLGTLPNSILEVANQNDFPLIGLPHEITWPIAIESFMNFFMNERIKIMNQVEEVQSQFINLVLENESVQHIADRIADRVGNPIILEDARMNLIAIGRGKQGTVIMELEESIIEHRLQDSFRNRILKSDYYQNIQRFRKKEKHEFRLQTADKTEILNRILPIFSNKSIYGFVSLLECRKSSSQTDLLVLENTITALALQLTKQFLNQQTFRKKTQALIDDLIHGRVQSQIMFEYDFYHMNWTNPMLAILVECTEPYKENDFFWNQSEEQISSILKKHLKRSFEQVIIGSNATLFTILVSYSADKVNDTIRSVREETKRLAAELEHHFGKSKFLIGVGGAYAELKWVSKSFKEANKALAIAKKVETKGNIIFFDDVGIHRIISMIPDSGELREFCNDFLSELIEADPDQGVLLETLHTYLLCDCGIKETAQKMFLHPNTVAYRIKKIKQIVKYDLESSDFKLTYLFAIESYKMLNDK